MKKSLTLSAALFATTVALAGCASGSGTAGSGTAGSTMPEMSHSASDMPGSAAPMDTAAHNAEDTMFVQGMIPHHSQAVEMSDIILGKQDIDPRVTALATKIKAEQAPEISTMTGWLSAWNEPSEMAAGHSMTGMMSGEELDKLKAAQGSDAARLFLTQMIAHHEGAVAMAKTQMAEGQNADALALGKNIASSQEAEIQEMQSLLGAL